MSHVIFGAHTKALCGLSEIPIGLNVLYFHLVYPHIPAEEGFPSAVVGQGLAH